MVSESAVLDLVATGPGPAGERQWLLSFDITKTSPVPLTYQDARLQTGAGEATGELAGRLTGQLRVRYDAAALPLRQFSVVSDQELTASAWTRPVGSTGKTAVALPVPAFPLVDGFVELSGAGSLTVDTSTTIRLRDSNGRGGVTAEDLQFGSSEDLFTVATLPAADAVRADLALTTDLLASARGRMVVTPRATGSTAPYGAVTVTRDAALDRLSSLTRPQAFAAFAQYASAVVAAEDVVDADLPLLQARLTDLYSPGDRLLELVTRQATARIVCGAAPSSPPSGAARPGQVRYCQALTDGQAPDAGSVRWTAADGATTTGGGDSSVGTAPSSHVAGLRWRRLPASEGHLRGRRRAPHRLDAAHLGAGPRPRAPRGGLRRCPDVRPDRRGLRDPDQPEPRAPRRGQADRRRDQPDPAHRPHRSVPGRPVDRRRRAAPLRPPVGRRPGTTGTLDVGPSSFSGTSASHCPLPAPTRRRRSPPWRTSSPAPAVSCGASTT